MFERYFNVFFFYYYKLIKKYKVGSTLLIITKNKSLKVNLVWIFKIRFISWGFFLCRGTLNNWRFSLLFPPKETIKILWKHNKTRSSDFFYSFCTLFSWVYCSVTNGDMGCRTFIIFLSKHLKRVCTVCFFFSFLCTVCVYEITKTGRNPYLSQEQHKNTDFMLNLLWFLIRILRDDNDWKRLNLM